MTHKVLLTFGDSWPQGGELTPVHEVPYGDLLHHKMGFDKLISFFNKNFSNINEELFDIPQVVCYKTSMISYLIGRLLIHNLKFISFLLICSFQDGFLNHVYLVKIVHYDFSIRF